MDAILLATLGMFILDQFQFESVTEPDSLLHAALPTRSKEGLVQQIGGGGTYASVGARIWVDAARIRMIVDRGHDWLQEAQAVLDSFGSMWTFRDDQSRQTTRAVNIYMPEEQRGFAYLTPKLRLTPASHIDSLEQGRVFDPAWLHFVCSPSRAIEICKEIQHLRASTPHYQFTKLLYEPIPDSCIADNLADLESVLPSIDILSPNHTEAGGFFALSASIMSEKIHIESCATRLAKSMRADSVVCVRSGKAGAYTLQNGRGEWCPAYHQSTTKIVDVTGAGNAFLGGLAYGMQTCSGDAHQAAAYGSVSASYAIEQWGLPRLNDKGWNGKQPDARLHALLQRA
ncbi:uncharacterized protein L969DRAFT_97157 [Mixia osmundae IAM 14324]|uniref:Carbohydrate kinase PfkB domain-containing protein n=1 Tax=Mixia osmundae (strain CBS 9802 / IAM 14324 / JCM 22182 / KY 12970) TaxID=764103 RepID=G7E1V6_MIXOS|nr:uncharacterized protein L969DRAFT_97157 [Mixia osmundae IAM 14324]KEI36762.1 hypothetical protein L969DRAFT_97157 [Mixia osmundae IAM 14324]GAA96816.1 hypothetical protein E5Q_03488 [Mixia osmundae IAM 14324]